MVLGCFEHKKKPYTSIDVLWGCKHVCISLSHDLAPDSHGQWGSETSSSTGPLQQNTASLIRLGISSNSQGIFIRTQTIRAIRKTYNKV